jgi:hypothetical protein
MTHETSVYTKNMAFRPEVPTFRRDLQFPSSGYMKRPSWKKRSRQREVGTGTTAETYWVAVSQIPKRDEKV